MRVTSGCMTGELSYHYKKVIYIVLYFMRRIACGAAHTTHSIVSLDASVKNRVSNHLPGKDPPTLLHVHR